MAAWADVFSSRTEGWLSSYMMAVGLVVDLKLIIMWEKTCFSIQAQLSVAKHSFFFFLQATYDQLKFHDIIVMFYKQFWSVLGVQIWSD